jgi:hypothetical protein
MALNCAILTYDGMAYFGFSGCAHAVPDLRRLETFLKLSFTELREAAGVRPAPKVKKANEKKVRAKAKVAPATARVPVPVPLRPVAPVDSRNVAVPPVEEENVLTRLTA